LRLERNSVSVTVCVLCSTENSFDSDSVAVCVRVSDAESEAPFPPTSMVTLLSGYRDAIKPSESGLVSGFDMVWESVSSRLVATVENENGCGAVVARMRHGRGGYVSPIHYVQYAPQARSPLTLLSCNAFDLSPIISAPRLPNVVLTVLSVIGRVVAGKCVPPRRRSLREVGQVL
jgi:hypothetical protein